MRRNVSVWIRTREVVPCVRPGVVSNSSCRHKPAGGRRLGNCVWSVGIEVRCRIVIDICVGNRPASRQRDLG